jgi:Ca2+-dependent lipid-binding protein
VTDPFVDVVLGRAKLAKTSVINNSLNPEWNESYRFVITQLIQDLKPGYNQNEFLKVKLQSGKKHFFLVVVQQVGSFIF